MRDYHMVSADNIRLYQEPYMRILDQPEVVGKKWRPGYVYDTFNSTRPNKPPPSRNWNKFPVSDPPTTNEYGDLEMHSDPGTYGWALCEDDRIRVGVDINKELKIQNSEVVPMWQSLLNNLGYLLKKLGSHVISSLKTAVCLYLNTCTSGQLGRTLAFIRKVRQWSPELRETLAPSKLFKELQKGFNDKKNNGKSLRSLEPSRG